jgi:hypothetical protein
MQAAVVDRWDRNRKRTASRRASQVRMELMSKTGSQPARRFLEGRQHRLHMHSLTNSSTHSPRSGRDRQSREGRYSTASSGCRHRGSSGAPTPGKSPPVLWSACEWWVRLRLLRSVSCTRRLRTRREHRYLCNKRGVERDGEPAKEGREARRALTRK